MGNLRKISDSDAESGAPMYMYSSENHINNTWVYLRCNTCYKGVIVCRPEDVAGFLMDMEDIECPCCGASVKRSFSLDIKVKNFLPLLNKLMDNRELNEFLDNSEEGQ